MTLPIRFSATGPSGWPETPDEKLETAELISGQPMGADHAYFTDAEKGIRSGIWRSTPYTEFYEDYPATEFMYILEGEVTLESDVFSETYRAGEAFLVPKGFRGTWKQEAPMLKYYIMID
ncbi:MAG: cupin domain-containing protein [Silicimonas sp.]|nr:cupin domain-containing protein [Silicimonas sp.]